MLIKRNHKCEKETFGTGQLCKGKSGKRTVMDRNNVKKSSSEQEKTEKDKSEKGK